MEAAAAPVKVAIVIEPGCWAGLALLVKEALAVAGTLHTRTADLAGSALFEVSLVGPSRLPLTSFTGPALTPDATFRSRLRPAIVVVPPKFYATDERQPLAAPLRDFLVRAYEDGATILSMASGVRVLAETGLLDGHEATGNPSDARAFALHYPKIRFSPEIPLVIDGRIISAATINPCLDACAYLIGQRFGEALAHKFTYYTNSVWHPTYERIALKNAQWKQHADSRIKQAQEFIERHFAQDITVASAARRAAMSARNFTRRFQAAVGVTPQAYLLRCRVEHARDLLAQPGTSVLQVALQCGFHNEIALRRCFRQAFGVTPSQHRATTAG